MGHDGGVPTCGLVYRPMGNSARASWSWESRLRKYVWSLTRSGERKRRTAAYDNTEREHTATRFQSHIHTRRDTQTCLTPPTRMYVYTYTLHVYTYKARTTPITPKALTLALLPLRACVVPRGHGVKVLPDVIVEHPELDHAVAHDVGVGRPPRARLGDRVAHHLDTREKESLR